MSGTWLVLPVKELNRAKQRLRPVLSQADRRRLMHRLAVRTFAAAADAGVSDRVLVVTSDEAVAGAARERGFELLADPGIDHSAAAALGTQRAAESGAVSVITVACDLPLLTAGDVRALAEQLAPRSFVIAPNASGEGTNAIAIAPPRFEFSFGPGSFRRHVLAAERLGLAVNVLRSDGLAYDLDDPSDLEQLTGRLPADLAWVTKAIHRDAAESCGDDSYGDGSGGV